MISRCFGNFSLRVWLRKYTNVTKRHKHKMHKFKYKYRSCDNTSRCVGKSPLVEDLDEDPL